MVTERGSAIGAVRNALESHELPFGCGASKYTTKGLALSSLRRHVANEHLALTAGHRASLRRLRGRLVDVHRNVVLAALALLQTRGGSHAYLIHNGSQEVKYP
jgi:hypothetical protein